MFATFVRADTFGSGANSFQIDFVTIGNPGNPGDPRRGSVPVTFRIGKYEISEDVVAIANTLGVLNISSDSRGPNKPATSISWNEAARFVNWLNVSSGYAAAYKFATQPGEPGYDANANIELWQPADAGYNPSNVYRNTRSQFFLPSMDEWYKAAYYDPSKDIYYDHATSSSQRPASTTGGADAGTIVYDLIYLYPGGGPADIDFAGGLSTYGTMAQAGNVDEWLETAYDSNNNEVNEYRHIHGGNWYSGIYQIRKTDDRGGAPYSEAYFMGFRVASNVIPEPSALVLAASSLGCTFLAWKRKRKRRRCQERMGVRKSCQEPFSPSPFMLP